LASLAAYIFLQIANMLVHGVILAGEYKALEKIWRPDMMDWMWLFNIMGIPTTLILVYIFAKGYENRGIAEGIRFGFWLGLLIWIGGAFASWAMFPITFSLALKWFIYGVLQMMLAGVVIALIYRPKAA